MLKLSLEGVQPSPKQILTQLVVEQNARLRTQMNKMAQKPTQGTAKVQVKPEDEELIAMKLRKKGWASNVTANMNEYFEITK